MTAVTTPGVLTSRELTQFIRGQAPVILTDAAGGIRDDQIQPASLDLTIGEEFVGMYRSTLPRPGETIEALTKRAEHSFTMEAGELALLHQGYTYLVRLNEHVRLPKGFKADFSPKSSIGRIDVFVRVLADGVPLFDRIPDGYQGRLWLEITPLSFRVKVYPGLPMIQMRIKMGDPRLTAEEVRLRQSHQPIFWRKEGIPIPAHALLGSERGIYMHVDLDRDIVGFVSRNGASPLSLDRTNAHDSYEYWEPIRRPRDDRIDLEPGKFYLLATKEGVRISEDLCGDIMAYDASAGEFRTHYAGFFDPDFGAKTGTIGVLEVRGRELPHSLFDGQPICLMVFEQLCSKPPLGYRGNYTDARPSLSKFFKDRYTVWE